MPPVAVAFDANSGQPRQPDDIHDVFNTGCAADDAAADRLRCALRLDLGNGAEGLDDVCRWAAERSGQRPLPAAFGAPCSCLLERRRLQLGMLADVERMQVKAEGAGEQQQGIEQGARQAQAAILDQAGANEVKVVEEFAR